MLKFISLIGAAVFLLNIGTAISAPKEQMVRWEDELDLSDLQKQQYKAIKNESREKVKSLMNQIDELHRQISEIHQQDESKLQNILNDKQKIKFDKIKARQNKNTKDAPKDKSEKKPSRKRMRQY